MENKIKTLEEVAIISKKAKEEGKKVVTTNGCFDILHVGHIENLEFAKRQGDVLIVGINSDLSVKASKGPTQPVILENDRAKVISALGCVDYVFIFDGSPLNWIFKIKPDVQVKNESTKNHPAFIPEKNEVEKYGGVIVLDSQSKINSTSEIIEKIQKLA